MREKVLGAEQEVKTQVAVQSVSLKVHIAVSLIKKSSNSINAGVFRNWGQTLNFIPVINILLSFTRAIAQ